MEKDEWWRVGYGSKQGSEGERKNEGKRRRILSRLQIKDQTNRSIPSAGCVSFFSIPFCPRAYPPFFSLSSRPLLSFSSPGLTPSGCPYSPSFLLPTKSLQVSEARATSKSHGLQRARDSRPPRCYLKRGRKA